MRPLALWLAVVALFPVGSAAQTVWQEAEAPTAVAGAKLEPAASRPGILSGDRWMTFSISEKAPADKAVTLSYRVNVGKAGRYVPWFRIGFEWVRADLAYRFDGGPWVPLPATRTTTNVVELGVWSEVAWDRGPALRLPAGARKLDVRFTTPKGSQRFLFGFDCFALVPEGTPWRPDNRLRPGQRYTAPADQQAATLVRALPAPTPTGERTTLKLDGLWQVARFDDPDMNVATYDPVKALPGPAEAPLQWRGIQVPSDAWQRPDLSFGHRLVYRTRVAVPAGHAGRSFQLEFDGHAWITSVFVDGKLAGSQQATLVPFAIDLTRHLTPGKTHTLEVAIKGSYYAIDHKPGELDRSRNQPRNEEFLKYLKWIDCTWPTGKGGGDSIQTGLTRSLRLVSAGGVRTSDVFVRPSVRAMRLDGEVELTNTTAQATPAVVRLEAVNTLTGQVEKRFDDRSATVPPRGTATVKLADAWPDAKLWWPAETPAERPVCYELVATVLVGGKPVDRSRTLFGFRELGVDGRHITLNGVRWRAHSVNALHWLSQDGKPNEEAYFRWNDRGVRMDGGVLADYYSRRGIPGRLSMTWEGMFGQVAMENPRMWENWKLHVAQMVRAYRNHPSVFHWSVGNEVQMITARLFFGDRLGRLERQMKEVYDVVAGLDPTRTVSEDGAGDLGGLGDSSNWHYVTGDYKVPRQFYEYVLGAPSTKREGVDYQVLNRWDGKRPLIQGEEMYFAGMGNFAWFGGPSVYRGRTQREAAGGRYERMYLEGARWQGVFQAHPWTTPLPGTDQAMARRAVFVREYNAAFFPKTTVDRTIKVFNDTRTDQTLRLRWRLELEGKVAQEGTKEYALKAGMDQEDRLALQIPAVQGARASGRLALELFAGEERVFQDERPVHVLPHLPTPTLAPGDLAVWDPGGRVLAWLKERGIPHGRIADLAGIPENAKTVLVGPNALEEGNRAAAAAALRALVGRGRTAIVLEQTLPLREADLPTPGIVIADRERGRAARPEWEKVGGHTGAIAHPMALAHPVLATLEASDFFTWAGDDQLNYRLSYATPPTGTVNLVQAGEDLTLAPLFELLVGRGSYLLSQLLIGEKLGKEPTADRLLQNALAWAAGRADARVRKTVVFAGGDAAFADLIERLGIEHTNTANLGDVLAPDVDVAVVRATPAALQALVADAARVRAMAERGGWLMLAGLDADGLAAFNKLVGIEHRLRPFRKESVLLEAMQDALAMGISDRDLQQVDPEVIAPWMGLQRVSGKVFSAVVDADDNLAPFAGLSSFAEGSDRPLTDGLTGETFWRYTQYLNANGKEPVVFTLDRPEPLASLEIWQSDSYLWAREVEVSVDGRVVGKTTLKNAPGWQTIALPGTPATRVELRLLSTYPATKQNVNPLVTFDEIRLRRRLPADWGQRVVPLTAPGGIVKYPLGKGGILLNQVRFDGDDLPENLAKKKILFAALLRNLGSTFRQ